MCVYINLYVYIYIYIYIIYIIQFLGSRTFNSAQPLIKTRAIKQKNTNFIGNNNRFVLRSSSGDKLLKAKRLLLPIKFVFFCIYIFTENQKFWLCG